MYTFLGGANYDMYSFVMLCSKRTHIQCEIGNLTRLHSLASVRIGFSDWNEGGKENKLIRGYE